MILQKEINLIKAEGLKTDVNRIVSENEQWYKEFPCSMSGKYHKHEPTMEIHIQRCMWFAVELCREINIEGEKRDIIFAAVILHDIGNIETSRKGKYNGDWRYYSETGWSSQNSWSHPTVGAEFIRKQNIIFKDKIAALIETHMSHWGKDHNPEPKTLSAYIVCIADYFASREQLVIKENG